MFSSHHPTLHSSHLQRAELVFQKQLRLQVAQMFTNGSTQDARQRQHALVSDTASATSRKQQQCEAPIAGDRQDAPASPTASVSSVESTHSDSESVDAAPARVQPPPSTQPVKAPSSTTITPPKAASVQTTTKTTASNTYRRFKFEAEVEPLSMDIHPRDKVRYQFRGEKVHPSVFIEELEAAHAGGSKAHSSVLAPQRVQAWWPQQLELQEKQQQQLLEEALSLEYTEAEDHDAEYAARFAETEPQKQKQQQQQRPQQPQPQQQQPQHHRCHQPRHQQKQQRHQQKQQQQQQEKDAGPPTSEALDAISRLQALRREHAHARRRAKEERRQRYQQQQQQQQQQQDEEQGTPAPQQALADKNSSNQVGSTTAKRSAQEAAMAATTTNAARSASINLTPSSTVYVLPCKRAHLTSQLDNTGARNHSANPSATQPTSVEQLANRTKEGSSDSAGHIPVPHRAKDHTVKDHTAPVSEARGYSANKGKAGHASNGLSASAARPAPSQSLSSPHGATAGSPGRSKRGKKWTAPLVTTPSLPASPSVVARARPMVVAKAGNGCVCCGITSTPMWRDGPNDVRLCNACGIRWQKYGVHCTGCSYIPRKVEKARGVCPKCQTKLPAAVATRRRLNSKASH